MNTNSKKDAGRKEKTSNANGLPPPEVLPDVLKNTPNWIVWKEEKKDGRLTKVPYNPSTGHKADHTNPDHGTTFKDAVQALSTGSYDGLGFIFTGTKYAGIDIDDCRNPKTGEVTDKAREIIVRFSSYTEISPSGTGFHILIIGSKPGNRCKTKDVEGIKELEIYDTDRFFTVTGDVLPVSPGYLRKPQDELDALYREFFGEPEQNGSDSVTKDINGEYPILELDDETIIRKLKNSKQAELFHRLFYGGKTTIYGSNNSQNEEDLALVNLLVFYTGNDPEQIDRLFRKSALCREKWTNRLDYRKRTIRKALKNRDRSDFYSGSGKKSTGQQIEKIIQNTPAIDWPNKRTNETDKATFRALLEVANQGNSFTISASVRRLSELSGVSIYATKTALDRLQKYELIEQTSEAEGPNSTCYRLTPDKSKHYSGHTSGTRTYCYDSSGITVDELQDVIFYPDALGRVSRSIVLMLRDYGMVDSMKKLAEIADTTSRTVRRKLNKLEDMEVVDTTKEGRAKKVWLQDDWREKLDAYREYAPTRYKDIERKIQHKKEQIIHAHYCEKKEQGEPKLEELPHAKNIELPSGVSKFVLDSMKVLKRLRKQQKDGVDIQQKQIDEMMEQLSWEQKMFSDRINNLARKLVDYLIEYEKRLYDE